MSLLESLGLALITVGMGLAAFAVLAPLYMRRMLVRVLNRPMSETLAELYVSTRSTPPMVLLYTSLRATSGDIVIRPMGSAKPAHGFDDLSFIPAQLSRRPVLETTPVELKVTIGHRARRPVTASLPLFISGMAWGLAVTRTARLAFARASGTVGIPLNSGQGPFLQEERDLCHAYVLQFGRWAWNRSPEILAQADMIEIQVGQGAMPGNAVLSSPDEVGAEIRQRMRLPPGEAPTIHADLYLDRPDTPATLQALVRHVRSVNPDVPVAVKLGAGGHLETDLDVAIDAGVDVICVDGTEGATGNAPVTLSDHFGITTLQALTRARAHLVRRGVDGEIDLMVSGGLREPGDFLKACALGARAVGIATAAMFAIAHPQLPSTLPFYPPTDLVFYRSRPQLALDLDRAALALTRFLTSCRKEMEVAIRTMGHRRIGELGPDDLVALDPDVARFTGLAFGGDPVAPHESSRVVPVVR